MQIMIFRCNVVFLLKPSACRSKTHPRDSTTLPAVALSTQAGTETRWEQSPSCAESKQTCISKKTHQILFFKYISHQNRIHHIIKQTIIRILIPKMRHLFKHFMEDIWFPFVLRTWKPISSASAKWGAKVFVGCTTEAKKKNYRQTETTPRRKCNLLPPFLFFLSFFSLK